MLITKMTNNNAPPIKIIIKTKIKSRLLIIYRIILHVNINYKIA